MKIILGLSGGIACYKAAELVRLLRKAGAEVTVVMTESAKQFITPLTMQALSGRPVRDDLFGLEAEHAMSHIELARWADLILIAPATANIIAKLAQGMADDLLTTVCLASEAPLFIAPAMNTKMWLHPVTQRNIQLLHATLLGPGLGEQACGEFGEGRMLEPEEIIARLMQHQTPRKLLGKRVLITAGPTRERLDPARCFTNFSSGKMGYALAEIALKEGAQVLLISGPTQQPVPRGVECVYVESAEEMALEVQQHLEKTDIFIGAAAVADYRPKILHAHKMKKTTHESVLVELVRNRDIIQMVAHAAERPACVVGFAAESENILEHAREKLTRKQLDFVVANDIGNGQVFGSDQNQGWILGADGSEVRVEQCAKLKFAQKILEVVASYVAAKTAVCYDSAP